MDWSQFVPDIVSAIITGLVVGGVFLAFERRLVSQRKRLDDESWFGRMERIEGVLSSPLPFTPESYRPYGDTLDRLEAMTLGIDAIHPKVARNLPEREFLVPMLRNFDVLRRSADEAERTTIRMLTKMTPIPSGSGVLVHPMIEDIAAVREVVQTASPEDPWTPISSAAAWRGPTRARLEADHEFAQAVAHYRTVVREIEGYRAAFVGYRSEVRWEHHKRSMERIQSENWNPDSRAYRRAVARDEREIAAAARVIFQREMEAVEATIPGC